MNDEDRTALWWRLQTELAEAYETLALVKKGEKSDAFWHMEHIQGQIAFLEKSFGIRKMLVRKMLGMVEALEEDK